MDSFKRTLGTFKQLCYIPYTGYSTSGAVHTVFKKTVNLTDWDTLIITLRYVGTDVGKPILKFGGVTLKDWGNVSTGTQCYEEIDVSGRNTEDTLEVTLDCNTAVAHRIEDLCIYEVEA